MTLRDRLRRWWSPAQWEDDHPSERKQGEQHKKSVLGRWLRPNLGSVDVGSPGPQGSVGQFSQSADFERDFKKPG
jgi:hypothetical protein